MISIISSPFEADEDLPWEYESDAFLGWYNEVFVESYKHPEDSVDSVDEAVADLRERGYEVND